MEKREAAPVNLAKAIQNWLTAKQVSEHPQKTA